MLGYLFLFYDKIIQKTFQSIFKNMKNISGVIITPLRIITDRGSVMRILGLTALF